MNWPQASLLFYLIGFLDYYIPQELHIFYIKVILFSKDEFREVELMQIVFKQINVSCCAGRHSLGALSFSTFHLVELVPEIYIRFHPISIANANYCSFIVDSDSRLRHHPTHPTRNVYLLVNDDHSTYDCYLLNDTS